MGYGEVKPVYFVRWISKQGGKYIDITAKPFSGDIKALYLYKADGVKIRLKDLGDGVTGKSENSV